MDLNGARMFVAAVQAGSLSAAADRLGIPLPTLSRRIETWQERRENSQAAHLMGGRPGQACTPAALLGSSAPALTLNMASIPSMLHTMPSVMKLRRPPGLLPLGVLLSVFSLTGSAADSVTSACRQNPAYCALLNGQEAGAAPTVRSGAEIASIAATRRFLSPELKLRIEQALHECAAWADAEVNRRRLDGNTPSRQQCQEVLPSLDPCGQKVTRAMQWGAEKHGLATQCVQEKLDPLIPGRFSLEPRYRYDRPTGQVQWLSPAEVRSLLQHDCGKELKGTVVPDVVIHSGNPLQAVSIYDFKFPCPPGNNASWKKYAEGHTNQGLTQGEVYVEALKTEAALVTPRRGIEQRIHP